MTTRKDNIDLDEQGRRRTLAPTALAQYLGQDSCDRFLRFYLHKGETNRLVQRLSQVGLPLQRALQPFGPLMAALGDRVETGVIEGLRAQGHLALDMDGQDEAATLAAVLNAGTQPRWLYQASVSGRLGLWRFEGRADLIRVRRADSGRLEILVGDVKSTRKDKVQHRLQVAVYVRLLQAMLAGAAEAADFQGMVVRRDPAGALQNPESAALFELDPYFEAVERLAAAPDSALARVDATPLKDLHYYIDYRCDGCLFNPLCLVESAERQDLALVPFLESADKRALAEHGIRTVTDLAALKTLPLIPPRSEQSNAAPPDRRLVAAPGQEPLVAALAEKWPVGPKLDRLVQRAARVRRYFEPETAPAAYGYFVDAGRSTLPDEQEYPELVKVFLDVQTDYLEDRIYLAGALVSGPQGRRSVVRLSPGVPDAERERTLLVEWVAGILGAVLEVAADQTAAPVHLYLYNRHDQRHLLEALRRHLDVFASLPALYDLLTETPALTQSAVSFIYDEVKEQRNLVRLGHTLQSVAFQMGFKWDDGPDRLYYRLFERGMFDYLLRRQSDEITIESAARFFSTIPLEYAYGAWGMFRAADFKPRQSRDVTPYLQVTTADIRQFQAKRLESLAYIESKLTRKNRYIKKEPLDLLVLGSTAATPPPFQRVLEEFLYIEHFARLQEHLELFNQPIARRVQQGRALLVRCVGLEDTEFRGKVATQAHFEAVFDGTGLEPAAAMQLSKIKEGDFVVLNSLEADGRAWDIVRGRLSIINAQEGTRLSLDLTGISYAKPKGAERAQALSFRYWHDSKLRPEPGQLYTLDEMVDDLNGDKLLEACRQAQANPFYHLLAAASPAAGLNQRQGLPPALARHATRFMELVREVEGSQAPTERQQAVIAGHLARKVFLVQGPPGTGKSHTLGWAVLARMYAERAADGGSLRVAVACHTHNAVNIVLQSIAVKLARLTGTEAGPLLEHLRLYKVGGDEKIENTVAGVEPLDPWEARRVLTQLLGSTLVVIGSTPGGLYKLMKQHTSHRPETLWNVKPFDLVILDEASQMNLPQALLASSWLREDGQLIVVGDHRQMAPILAHGWADEDRLSAIATQPYRSVFQYLLDRQFPRVALDESFRLHSVQAEFLYHNIYRQDDIPFHSRRRHLLPVYNGPDRSPYLQAVLHPDYPIIVVEHAERGSQQANPTEAELLAPVVEACLGHLELDGSQGLGLVVPHRAQKALLRSRFPRLAQSDAVDTVERFQGDEREVIIVSATASDPDYVRAEAEFLLNPNRLNVALSRPRRKLIVVASAVVFNFLSADLEIFDQAVLWKRLLSQCARELLWEGEQAGTRVRVLGCQS